MDDLLIVGGGPIGATLALLLRDSGLRYRVLDARPARAPAGPDRTLALSYNARLLYERIGIWQTLDSVSPIETIEVSQKGGFGITTLTAREADVPALGYVISYNELQSALDRALESAGIAVAHGCRVQSVRASAGMATIDLQDSPAAPKSGEAAPVVMTEHPNGDGARFTQPANAEDHFPHPVEARLIVVADGSGEAIPGLRRRKIEYRQRALIGNVECDAPQRGVAFERFTTDGPVALLPNSFGYALIWTATPERAALLRVQDDADFLDALHQHFGDRVGRFTSISGRNVFPLSLQFSAATVGERWVVLGNAAQALHPIAGQGFNLGLRDVWDFAQAMQDAPGQDVGAPAVLAAYARTRRVDRWAGMLVTHGLVGAFATDQGLLNTARGLGLTLLDSIPPLKRALTRAMQNGIR